MTSTSTTKAVIGKAPTQTPLVDASGRLAREWLPFIASLTNAGASIDSASSAIASLQTTAATSGTNVTALQSGLTSAQNALTEAAASLASLQTALTALTQTQAQQALEINALRGATAAGNLSEADSDVLTITDGTGAVLGAGTTIQVKQASGTQAGYLSAADWLAFSGASGALTHEEILVDTLGPISESTGDFIYVLGVPN